MLTLKERYVMEYVYQKCQGKKSCLISPREIISFVADKYVLFLCDKREKENKLKEKQKDFEEYYNNLKRGE